MVGTPIANFVRASRRQPNFEEPSSMRRCSNRSGITSPAAIAMAIVVAALASWWLVGDLAWSKTETSPAVPHLSDIARKRASETSAKPAQTKHAVTIRPGPSAPRIAVHSNVAGESQSVSVACSTCHATRLPVVANKQTSDLGRVSPGTGVFTQQFVMPFVSQSE